MVKQHSIFLLFNSYTAAISWYVPPFMLAYPFSAVKNEWHNAGTVSLVEAWAAKQPGDRTIEEMEPHQSYHSNSVWSITQITRISRHPSRTGLGCWSDQRCFGKTQLRTSNWGLQQVSILCFISVWGVRSWKTNRYDWQEDDIDQRNQGWWATTC